MSSRHYPDRLAFQSRSLTTAASGQVAETFATQFSRFGKVTQTAATESEKNDQLRTQESYRIELPRDTTAAAIDASWRILWRDQQNVQRTLNLTGVDSGSSGRGATILLFARL